MPPLIGRSLLYLCTWALWLCSTGPRGWPTCTAQALSMPGQPATPVKIPDPQRLTGNMQGTEVVTRH